MTFAATSHRRPVFAETPRNPLASSCQPEPETVTDGKALVALNAAIDRSGLPRKALASACGISEAQFSRLTSGVQAFPLAWLDRLPRDLALDVLDRLAADRGAHVVAEDADVCAAEKLVEAAEAFLSASLRTRKVTR